LLAGINMQYCHFTMLPAKIQRMRVIFPKMPAENTD